jgi:hypothetical protein
MENYTQITNKRRLTSDDDHDGDDDDDDDDGYDNGVNFNYYFYILFFFPSVFATIYLIFCPSVRLSACLQNRSDVYLAEKLGVFI